MQAFFITFNFMFRRKLLRFVLNVFPPLFFNRIILKKVSEDYTEFKVVLRKSILNMNFHKTIFGGTIFSAFDPYFPTMYYNIFQQKNRKLEIWLKSANIKYERPANTDLHITFTVSTEDIIEAENALNKTLLKHNSRIVEYTVAPSFISKNKSGFHQWMIEFEKAPANISKFCEDLDKNLQKFNSDYKSKRFKNITMKRLEIIVAKEKLFFDWLKFKKNSLTEVKSAE